MSDEFVLSQGQGSHLESAFRRNNWTVALVHQLCEGDVLTRVKLFLRNATNAALGFGILFVRMGGTDQELRSLGEAKDEHFRKWREELVKDLIAVMRREKVIVPATYPEMVKQMEAQRDANQWETYLRHKENHLYKRDLIKIEEVFTKEYCCDTCGCLPATFTVTMKILAQEGIHTLLDLVQKTEAELLRIPNFGRKGLNMIKDVLHGQKLHLGMEFPNPLLDP